MRRARARTARGGARERALVTLLFLLTLGGDAALAQDRVPAGYEEGLFDVAATGIQTPSLPVLVSPAGKFLVPVRQLLDPLSVPYHIAADSGVLHVSRPGGAGTASLYWHGSPRIELAGTTPLDSDDVYSDGDRLFVAATRLAQLIEGTIDVDVGTLTIVVKRETGFPAQIKLDAKQRRRIEAEQAAAELAMGDEPPGAAPFRARTGVGVMEWAFGGPMHGSSAPSTLDLRGGMGLQGGMLQVHGMVLVGSAAVGGTGMADPEFTYRRVFPGGRWLQQLQLGSIYGEGGEARPMQGISLTNAPFVRGLRFDDVAFSRPLPPGWEYELYEGGRLIGFADDSRAGPMNVPLRYGTTPLRIKLYGPAGEIVESTVSYVIPIEQLRAGEWQYAAGAGRCAQLQCSGLWYADLRRGLTRTLTVQAGADAQRDSAWRGVRPYGAVSFLPAPGWSMGLQARRDSYVRASIQSFTDAQVSGAVTGGVNLPGEGGVAVTTGSSAVWFAQSQMRVRGLIPKMARERAVLFTARMEGSRDGGSGRWDFAATTPIRVGMLELGVESDPFALPIAGATQGPPLARIAPTIQLGSGIFRRLAYPIVRLEAGLQNGQLVQWEAALSMQPGRGFVSATLRHAPGLGGTQLTIGGSYALGVGRILGRVMQRAGRIDGGYSASGAVAFGSVRHATPLEYGGLGLSGVEGHVFRDVDGDGKLGERDEPVAGAIVRVGGLVTRTGPHGEYSVWNVLPYQAVSVRVDTLSLEDPGWVPALPSRALRLSPQQYTSVEFGLVRTRELTGTLVPGAKIATTAGVGLELRDVTGGTLNTARTFSDGGFYFSRVRPGHYTLSIARSSATALGITAPPQLDVVIAADGDDVIELKPVTLERGAETTAPK